MVDLKTMHFGAETVMVAMKAEFRPELRGREVVGAIERMEGEIRRRRGEVKYVYVEPTAGRGNEE